MKRQDHELSASEMEAFFAVEREILPESAEFRERAMKRARASLQQLQTIPYDALSPSPRRFRIGMVAAAAVTLPALCAAAFVAGYRTRDVRESGPSALSSMVVRRTTVPSVVTVMVPVQPLASVERLRAEPPGRTPSAPLSKSAGAVQSGAKAEVYAAELRVLQPARQAVAQHDFNQALATIAEHQRMYPAGILAEEREALRVRALVGLGRVAEAERAGAAFRKNFPRSALLRRIDEMLGSQK